jgi:hypothetical protein
MTEDEAIAIYESAAIGDRYSGPTIEMAAKKPSHDQVETATSFALLLGVRTIP